MSTSPGCRCIACYHGAPHQPPNEAEIERCLARAGHAMPLRLVQHDATTTRQAVATACTGKPDCDCAPCQSTTLRLVKRGAHGAGPSSPFRKLRRAA